jgi:hypothetical protein
MIEARDSRGVEAFWPVYLSAVQANLLGQRSRRTVLDLFRR